MFSSSTFISVLALAGLVASHGLPGKVTVDGKTYAPANLIGADPKNSPIRAVTNSGTPIKDAQSTDLPCGVGAAISPVVAPAKAGSTISMSWQPEGLTLGANWFHKDGPIMTYMTSCGDDCTKFTPNAQTKWFKIDQQGYQPGGTVGGGIPWVQSELLKGSPATVKLPSDLPNGNYLLRQEIITLQVANNIGGAEFYPGCVQLKVTGGSSSGTPSNTVTFPGAYSATDPGIKIDAFTPTGAQYQFPGGPVASFSGSGSVPQPDPAAPGSSSDASGSSSDAPGSSSDAPGSSAPVNAAPAPSPSPASASPPAAPSSSTGKCKSKKAKRDAASASAAALRKKALSAHKKRRMTSSQ